MRILLISGSTRQGSGNTATLRTAQAMAPAGVTTELYDGLAALPAFNPDDDRDPLPPAVVGLRSAITSADAVLFCTRAPGAGAALRRHRGGRRRLRARPGRPGHGGEDGLIADPDVRAALAGVLSSLGAA